MLFLWEEIEKEIKKRRTPPQKRWEEKS